MANANPSSMWSSGSRNISAPVNRNQSTPLSSQQAGQDAVYSPPSSRMGGQQQQQQQGSFRFGNQQQPQSAQQPSAVDDFPPLSRANGDMGFAAGQQGPNSRGNGLLNALSANNRTSETRTPPGLVPGRAQGEDGKTDGSPASGPAGSQQAKASGDKELQAPEGVDLLEGMPESDKWSIKGLRTLMNNYADFHAMSVGLDPQTLGLDVTSPEMLSSQVFSLFEDAPARPTVVGSRFMLPDCYSVNNVQPIETKIQSFNEETLFWIFYSCPYDIKQQMAAVELHSRNWRWHKKLQVWLTKDESMTPAILSPVHERGYYIVWDTTSWRKDRVSKLLFAYTLLNMY